MAGEYPDKKLKELYLKAAEGLTAIAFASALIGVIAELSKNSDVTLVALAVSLLALGAGWYAERRSKKIVGV